MFKWLKRKFLKIFGDIKIFTYPMWIVYDPSIYELEGEKLRNALNTLKPGDIVGRRYIHYADGYFIPGKYSHTGIYIGDNKIIHSVAEGVCEIDILDFLKCDGCFICRYKKKCTDDTTVTKAIEEAKSRIGTKYDFSFKPGDEELYCHELTAFCYRGCKLDKHIPTIFFGLIKGKDPVYLARSFMESPDFEVVYET